MVMEAATIMTSIGLGLKLIDQARGLFLRFRGETPTKPSASMQETPEGMELTHNGQRFALVRPEDLKLDQWDSVRYDALRRRVEASWSLFHELWAQLPLLSADEQARIKLRMEKIKEELCQDFKDMREIYERTLGIDLPDHYQLYEVCA